MSPFNPKCRRGGVAIEYLVISTFAAVMSIGVATYLGKVFSEKLRKMSDQLGVEAELPDTFDFSDP